MSVKTKLAILVLLITALPLVGFGVVSYDKTRDILSASIQESLQSIVDIKTDKQERYMKARNTTPEQPDNKRRVA